MDTHQTASTAADAQAPQRSAEGKHRDAFALVIEIEESLAHARTLNDLAWWIGAARGFIDQLRCAALNDDELAKRLKSHSLALYSPEWSDAEVEALQHLHMVIGENLQSVASACRLSDAAAAQTGGPRHEH